jgi:hypothetical protein
VDFVQCFEKCLIEKCSAGFWGTHRRRGFPHWCTQTWRRGNTHRGREGLGLCDIELALAKIERRELVP